MVIAQYKMNKKGASAIAPFLISSFNMKNIVNCNMINNSYKYYHN